MDTHRLLAPVNHSFFLDPLATPFFSGKPCVSTEAHRWMGP